jgi:bacterioferritin (cytochrome b1)
MPNDDMLKGLRTALETEMNGVEFYRTAAQQSGDFKAKSVFQILANDEAKHFIELKKHYDVLLKTGKWEPAIELGKPTEFKGENPIFSDDFKSRIKDRHYEMSALSIGALLETNSIDFYRQMKDRAQDPAAKRFFGELQSWEETHLDAIVKQLDLVKEEFWQNAHWQPY